MREGDVVVARTAWAMTSRPTFGEFIHAADQQLDQAFAELAVARTRADARTLIAEATSELRRLVAVISRYAGDLTPTGWQVPERDRPLMTAWGRAMIEAREALERSAAFLRRGEPGQEPGPDDADRSPFSRRLESAARALAIGRDLLGTHFATRMDGTRNGQSEWAPVIDSDPVSRALITDIASLAAVTGSHCERLSLASGPGTQESAQARRRLSAACYWLMAASTAVQSAGLADPVPDDARELLHAIPVNTEPARPIQRGGETITELCEDAIVTAERARRASRTLTRNAAWSPATSGTSLRHAAAACAATSYHCEVLLQSLAAQHGHDRDAHLRSQLLQSADAVRNARAAWLRAAHAWDQMTTDAPKVISRAAADAADLAYWTGRLAFADPDWTVSRGPSQAVRPPESLAATPEDARHVTAAVHHACDTITRLAEGDFQQVHVAARAGRLLVPTSSLDESFDIPHPIARAPAYRAGFALATYRDAGAASHAAAAAMEQVAATVGAPSRILITARNAITANNADVQHKTTTGDPQAASSAREAQSAGRGAGQLACHPALAHDRLPRRGSAASRGEEQGVVDAGQKPRLLPKQPAREVSRPDAVARPSDALATRQVHVNAMVRPPPPARTKEPELEP